MRHAKWVCGAGVWLVGLGGGVAGAQTPVVNPTQMTFTPSADHAVVDRYEARCGVQGGAAVPAWSLGKPVPVSGMVTVPLPLTAFPLSPTTLYVCRVAAVGTTGEGVSAESNPFVHAGPPAPPGTPVVKR